MSEPIIYLLGFITGAVVASACTWQYWITRKLSDLDRDAELQRDIVEMHGKAAEMRRDAIALHNQAVEQLKMLRVEIAAARQMTDITCPN